MPLVDFIQTEPEDEQAGDVDDRVEREGRTGEGNAKDDRRVTKFAPEPTAQQ